MIFLQWCSYLTHALRGAWAQIASASTLAVMLDGPSSFFLQGFALSAFHVCPQSETLFYLGRAPPVFSVLLLLLLDSSYFKIRIQAAVALAMPTSILEHGKSFSDVVQGLEHIIENLGSDRVSAPSNF